VDADVRSPPIHTGDRATTEITRDGHPSPRPAACHLAASAVVVPAPVLAVRDRDGNDIRTQRQAQRFFKRHDPNNDPHKRDSDNDEKACENLPRR
jgi:hypothetical protein